VDRRQFVGTGIIVACGIAARAQGNSARGKGAMPRDFLWGAATAGHQVEGNNVNSDIWLLENIKPTRFPTRSGDACDSYHRFEEDIRLLKAFGLDTYRFSIEWSRIEPSPGQFSQAELDFYKSKIDICHRYGVKPAVTFNHYACPLWFSAQGGWTADDSSDLFSRYCDIAARQLGDGMHVAFTLNEPQVKRLQHWIKALATPERVLRNQQALEAARRASGSEKFVSFHLADDAVVLPKLIDAHKVGYQAIKAAHPSLPVGVTLAIVDYQAVGPDSRMTEIRSDIDGAWMEAAKTGDFVGVQNYGRMLIDSEGEVQPAKGAERNGLGQEYYPAGLGNAVRTVHAATGKPILVSENGICTNDDTQRVRFIDEAVAGLHSTMVEGVPVLGYIHWSLLDNYEWSLGYGPKFGLVAVDRKTFVRAPKPSAEHLGKLASGLRAV